MKRTDYLIIAIVTAALLSQNLIAETIWLDELDISKAVSGWETSQPTKKDLGTYSESFETPVPSYGVVLIRLFSK